MLTAHTTSLDTPAVPARARVAVQVAGDATCLEPAAALARELGLPLIDSPLPDFDLLLAWTGKRLELRDNRDPRVGPVTADLAHAARRRLTARDPLVRAIGRTAQTVVDATLGLGADACMLVHYGYAVLGIERHPVVAALVRDGLERFMRTSNAMREEACPRPVLLPEEGNAVAGTCLRLIEGQAHDILPALDPRPDVVYLDPMFPVKRRRSAAVSKEMRLLRLLAGDDMDAHELLEVARHTARERVVVKRPDHAGPLAPRPTVSYGGKLIRYDVYRTDLAPTP